MPFAATVIHWIGPALMAASIAGIFVAGGATNDEETELTAGDDTAQQQTAEALESDPPD